MDGFRIDVEQSEFLDQPSHYAKADGRLQLEPLKRQFKTVKEILKRFNSGHGVLLADDVGLGKTTVGALVAWVTACQNKRVRIYAPNDVLARRWTEELTKHVPMFEELGATHDRIRGNVARLHAGRIQVTTHHSLVKGHSSGEQRTACDLMIIDEAHRAKGEGSAFNEALRELGGNARRKLILTATPFSIRLAELQQLLEFVGASKFDGVKRYANEMKRLYELGDAHDVTAVSKRLVMAAMAAINELEPFVIRHSVEELSAAERKHFGAVDSVHWNISAPSASTEDLQLLLRMDRLLQLASAKKGARRNDPRFHVGWQYTRSEVERVAKENAESGKPILDRHIVEAKKALAARSSTSHPKIRAVCEAIRPLVDVNEKVLIFCHHHAVAHEVLAELERFLRVESIAGSGPSEQVWRKAWEAVLHDVEDPLGTPVVDWLCTEGIRRQVGRWLGEPATTVAALKGQLLSVRPRYAGPKVPTIAESAKRLLDTLLQSASIRAILRNISKGTCADSRERSHFPGLLDEGLPVMGSWKPDEINAELPRTLYAREADIVIALFNSPFGPDVLVTTDHLSEGVDLHRWCRHLIHYELDPSPVRTLQRNGRVRRVGSWAALTEQPIRYAFPTFGGTRDERAVEIMRQRMSAFGLLLGGVPSFTEVAGEREQSFAEAVLRCAGEELEVLNRKLAVAG